MKRERRAELIRKARYFAAGLVENAEPTVSGSFDELTEEEHELIEAEMQRISKRIYPEAVNHE
ncbi:hypothetical protein M3M50_10580 [Pseudomonas bijieensis]|uniref:hypothetical protein n=1 Tax=Pseudomonas bijieensis TaxID=2681983 RepID=UPI00200F13C4|nr:hypothetical protein [Pseudomonas bijieensis]UQI33045.1 hypothetical protein M3M50_10580 [Pseudomonas bijieensis]